MITEYGHQESIYSGAFFPLYFTYFTIDSSIIILNLWRTRHIIDYSIPNPIKINIAVIQINM